MNVSVFQGRSGFGRRAANVVPIAALLAVIAWPATVPAADRPDDTLPLVCEVTDAGTPALTRYRRVVVTIAP